MRAEAAQLALGLAAQGYEIVALGALGPWRHTLRVARLTAVDAALQEERALLQLLHEYEPSVIHAFGAEAAHRLIPLVRMMGATGVATLGHGDVHQVHPTHLRAASAIFVSCDYLRDQFTRRIPGVPVLTTGYLVAPPEPVPAAARHFLAEGLGIEDGAQVVLLADYFRGSETDTAFAVMESAELVADRVPEVQFLLVGGGPRLAELEGRAAAVNTRCGRRVLLLPGHRDDVTHLLALATVAVGSGRFAAEALAAGVAVVAAGAAGMLGTVTPESLQVAQFACYGRHGHLDATSPKALASEIVGLFQYADYREQFARDGQTALQMTAERSRLALEVAASYRRAVVRTPGTKSPARLLAVLPHDLREMLFTLPALSGLHQQYAMADIRLLASPTHCDFLERLNLAHMVAPLPQTLHQWGHAVQQIRRFRPDANISFTTALYGTALAGCTGAPYRVGMLDGFAALGFSDHLPTRTVVSPARALQLVQGLGISDAGPLPKLTIPPDVRDVVDLSLLAAGIDYNEQLILLCPQAPAPRAWPKAHWEALMARLLNERPECIAVIAGEGEFSVPSGVVPIMPVQDPLRFAALLARASIVIAPDTGALHLATLVGIPAVALYGPTSPEVCALPNAQAMVLRHDDFPCHPCRDTQCTTRRCMASLTPEEVATCVDALLSTSRL